MENTGYILHYFPSYKKGNPFLFSFIYYTLLINQAILTKILTEKGHAIKKH